MSVPTEVVIMFLVFWVIVGGGVGIGMMGSYHYKPSLWETANWAQRIVLVAFFGPLFWVIYVGGCFMKRFIRPCVALGWRWLGKL